MGKFVRMIGIVVFAAIVGFGFVGCEKGNDDNTNVSFESFSSPSIRVENLTSQRLVAFKNSVAPNTLISGIPAFATNHGLRKNTELFNATGNFVLILVTEADYEANKSNLNELNNRIFARIFAFYNHSGTNANVFQISSSLGGEGKLTVSNTTAFNVEIRKDGPTGEILGFAAPRMTSGNVINLQAPGSYDIYPVFKFYSHIDNELYSVIPKYRDGDLAGQPFMRHFGFADGAMTRTFNVGDIYQDGDFNMSSGSMYFRVINNNTGTDIRFWEGGSSIPKVTSMGIDLILSSHTETFTIRFPRNPDGTYYDTHTIAGLTVGTNQLVRSIPSQVYELDYIYELEVTGTTGSNLQIGTVTKRNKVDLDIIFGLTN